MSSPQNDEQTHADVQNSPVPAGSQPGGISPSHRGDQLRDYLTQDDHPHDAAVFAQPQLPQLQPGPQQLKTTPGTLDVGLSNTSEDASTSEEPCAGSSGMSATRPDDGLNGVLSSGPQRARSTENFATSEQSPTTHEQVSGRALNPDVSTDVGPRNFVEPRHQLSRAMTMKREAFFRSAQEQAYMGTSSAYLTQATDTPSTSPTSDFYQETLASQYTTEGGAFEYSVSPFPQYFNTL